MDTRYDFPYPSEEALETLRRSQQRIFEIACTTAEIFEDAGITYALAWGTLLGAVRHKGFIPWDDDFDFWVDDTQYEDALAILRERLPENLIVHDKNNDPCFWSTWAHVRDLRSRVIYQQHKTDTLHRFHGLCIDLFHLRLDDAELLPQHWWDDRMAFIERKREYGLMDEEQYQRYMESFEYMFKVGFVDNPHHDTGTVVTDDFNWSMGPRDKFFPLGRAEFEGVSFPVPKDTKYVLDSIYMNAWEPPEYEDRRGHFAQVEFF